MFTDNNSLKKGARRDRLDKQVFQKGGLFADIIFLASSKKPSKKEILQPKF